MQKNSEKTSKKTSSNGSSASPWLLCFGRPAEVVELAPEVKKAAAAAAAENITMAEVTWCGIRAGAYGEKGILAFLVFFLDDFW